jgi:acyl-CoA thioesterase FadM
MFPMSSNKNNATNQKNWVKLQSFFGQADPAGILYFANVIGLAHQAYEIWLKNYGYQWEKWFQEHPAPLRRVQADFFAPLFPGREYWIKVIPQTPGESSFENIYEIYDNDHSQKATHDQLKPLASIRLLHVLVDIQTAKKRPLTKELKELLEKAKESD